MSALEPPPDARRWFCPDCGTRLVPSDDAAAFGIEYRPRCPNCGFVRYRNPIVGVAVVVRDGQGRVLLGRRSKGVYAGLWCIPCGYVEWDEHIRDSARREFAEETGLEVETGTVAAVHSNFHNSSQHTVGIWFEGTVIGGRLEPVDGELSELAYFDPAEPPDLAFPTDALVLEDLAKATAPRPARRPAYVDLIREVPGTNRCDVTPIFADAAAFAALIEDLVTGVQPLQVEAVAGIDALGFVLGAAIAAKLNVGLITIRKGGKLSAPADREEFVDYSGESKTLELGPGAAGPNQRILIVDEWIETGAQVSAAIALIQRAGGTVAGIATISMDENERTRGLRQRYPCVVADEL